MKQQYKISAIVEVETNPQMPSAMPVNNAQQLDSVAKDYFASALTTFPMNGNMIPSIRALRLFNSSNYSRTLPTIMNREELVKIFFLTSDQVASFVKYFATNEQIASIQNLLKDNPNGARIIEMYGSEIPGVGYFLTINAAEELISFLNGSGRNMNNMTSQFGGMNNNNNTRAWGNNNQNTGQRGYQGTSGFGNSFGGGDSGGFKPMSRRELDDNKRNK